MSLISLITSAKRDRRKRGRLGKREETEVQTTIVTEDLIHLLFVGQLVKRDEVMQTTFLHPDRKKNYEARMKREDKSLKQQKKKEGT